MIFLSLRSFVCAFPDDFALFSSLCISLPQVFSYLIVPLYTNFPIIFLSFLSFVYKFPYDFPISSFLCVQISRLFSYLFFPLYTIFPIIFLSFLSFVYIFPNYFPLLPYINISLLQLFSSLFVPLYCIYHSPLFPYDLFTIRPNPNMSKAFVLMQFCFFLHSYQMGCRLRHVASDVSTSCRMTQGSRSAVKAIQDAADGRPSPGLPRHQNSCYAVGLNYIGKQTVTVLNAHAQ